MYTSAHLSLAVLEILVHTDWSELETPFLAAGIDVPDDSVEHLDAGVLPLNWRLPQPNAELTAIGEQWYCSGQSLILSVPSAVVPQERNFLLNPDHRRFRDVVVAGRHDFRFDDRLRR